MPALQGTRLPCTYGHQGRPQRNQESSRPRPQAPHRVICTAHPYRLGRKQFSLGKNRNYQYVYRKGKSIPSRYMVLVYLSAHDMKAGYSVSSKVGNSVVRSRLTRWFREDFRHLRPSLKEGKYIFVARVAAKDAPHSALTANMRTLVSRAGVLRDDAVCPSGEVR